MLALAGRLRRKSYISALSVTITEGTATQNKKEIIIKPSLFSLLSVHLFKGNTIILNIPGAIRAHITECSAELTSFSRLETIVD